MISEGTPKRADTFGDVVLVYFTNGNFDRGHDAATLARAWLQLGPEKFREKYKFDWTPSERLLNEIKRSTHAAAQD